MLVRVLTLGASTSLEEGLREGDERPRPRRRRQGVRGRPERQGRVQAWAVGCCQLLFGGARASLGRARFVGSCSEFCQARAASRPRRDAMRCDAMQGDAMRCNAMRCAAMRGAAPARAQRHRLGPGLDLLVPSRAQKRPEFSYLPLSGAAGWLLGGLQQDSLQRIVRHFTHTRGNAAASGADKARESGRMKQTLGGEALLPFGLKAETTLGSEGRASALRHRLPWGVSSAEGRQLRPPEFAPKGSTRLRGRSSPRGNHP